MNDPRVVIDMSSGSYDLKVLGVEDVSKQQALITELSAKVHEAAQSILSCDYRGTITFKAKSIELLEKNIPSLLELCGKHFKHCQEYRAKPGNEQRVYSSTSAFRPGLKRIHDPAKAHGITVAFSSKKCHYALPKNIAKKLPREAKRFDLMDREICLRAYGGFFCPALQTKGDLPNPIAKKLQDAEISHQYFPELETFYRKYKQYLTINGILRDILNAQPKLLKIIKLSDKIFAAQNKGNKEFEGSSRQQLKTLAETSHLTVEFSSTTSEGLRPPKQSTLDQIALSSGKPLGPIVRLPKRKLAAEPPSPKRPCDSSGQPEELDLLFIGQLPLEHAPLPPLPSEDMEETLSVFPSSPESTHSSETDMGEYDPTVERALLLGLGEEMSDPLSSFEQNPHFFLPGPLQEDEIVDAFQLFSR